MTLGVRNQDPSDHRLGEGDQVEFNLRGKGLHTICTRLVHKHPVAHFIQKFESVLGRWSFLLSQTKLSCEIPSTDRRVITVLRALDQVITAGNGDKLLSRLARVQLVRVLDILEARVAMERQGGHLHRRSGYRNASIVLDIYMSAQAEVFPFVSRRTLTERKRVAKRWSELAGPWPLFLLVYSEEAEEIVQRRNMPDNTTLRLIASRVFRESPSQLLETCEHGAEAAELAAVAKRPVDDQIVKKLCEACKIGLENMAAGY
ncbi:hypothetical protein RB601_003574 [Gaeumannomyces tritici]